MKAFQFILDTPKATDTLVSEKFNADKDLVRLNVEIKEKYSSKELFKEPKDLFIKHKFRFSFSTGVFANGITERQFYLTPSSSDTTSNLLVPENDSEVDIAFGALANLHYRLEKDFGLGLNFGSALSIADAKMRYLVGAGFAIGRKNTLIISFGTAFGRVKRLSGIAANLNNSSYSIPNNLGEAPTYSTWDQSWYMGVSYSVFNTK